MKISAKLREKVTALLAEGKSFAVYRIPDKTPKLVEKSGGKVDFYISPWRTCFADNLLIGKTDEGSPAFDLPSSTDKDTYIYRVGELIRTLRSRGMAKTVISRVIAGQSVGIDWIQAAEDLWNAFRWPSATCSIPRQPEVGSEPPPRNFLSLSHRTISPPTPSPVHCGGN